MLERLSRERICARCRSPRAARRGAAPASTTGRASSTRCRRCCSSSCSCSRCSCSAQFFLAREITEPGHGARPAQPPDRRADRSAGAGALEPAARSRRTSTALQTTLQGERGRPRRACSGMLESGAGAAQARGERARRRRSRPRSRRPARALSPGRAAEPADRGACAASSPRSRRRSTPPKRATRRARPASPISAAASTSRWRSGCRSSRATAPTSSAACAQILGNRPDIRIVGDRFVFQSEVLFRAGQAILTPEALRELDRSPAPSSSSRSRSRRTSPGCCGSTATPTCARSPRRSSPRTGSCPPRAPSRWCST